MEDVKIEYEHFDRVAADKAGEADAKLANGRWRVAGSFPSHRPGSRLAEQGLRAGYPVNPQPGTVVLKGAGNPRLWAQEDAEIKCAGAQITATGRGIDIQWVASGPQGYAQLIAAIYVGRPAISAITLLHKGLRQNWHIRGWEAKSAVRGLLTCQQCCPRIGFMEAGAANEEGARYRALLELLRTAETLWNASRVFFARWGIGPSQFNVLNLLADLPEGCTQIELSRQLIMHRSNVTGLVDRMEARGLVKRKPSPKDRRAFNVVLTAEGRRLVAEIQPEYYKAAEAVWRGVPSGKARELVAELEKVCRNAEEIGSSAKDTK